VYIVQGCTNGINVDQWCWPDGGCYLDQPNIVINIFAAIKNELRSINGERSRVPDKRHR